MQKQRIAYVDILKGLLIILVVMGHIPGASQSLHQWIYWFHMPAFFMVSGFFIKENFSLKDEVVGKFRRLLVPYLFFSLVLGTVARDGNVLKQAAGTLIGANGNITLYTFPFYFLTVLFFALVFIYAMKAKLKTTKSMAIGVAALYVLSHLIGSFIPDRLLGWIPWNIDMAIFAVAFLFIGNVLFNNELRCMVGGASLPTHSRITDSAVDVWHLELQFRLQAT